MSLDIVKQLRQEADALTARTTPITQDMLRSIAEYYIIASDEIQWLLAHGDHNKKVAQNDLQTLQTKYDQAAHSQQLEVAMLRETIVRLSANRAEAERLAADTATETPSQPPFDLRRIQEEQRAWSHHNFGDQPSWKPLLGVVEEVGELAHAHLKRAQQIRTGEDHTTATSDAVGDIMIFLMDFCSSVRIDLQDALEATWNDVKQRDWKKWPKTGRPEPETNVQQELESF